MLLTGAGCVLMALILYISGVNGEEKSICVLRGSSVDLLCSAQHYASIRKWYTVHHDGQRRVQKELFADETHVRFNVSNKGLPTLTINDVRENDTNLYCCSSKANKPELCNDGAVQLIVSDLQVKVIPDTEGQTVTLMCSTSCPLTEKPAAYKWYKNREFLYEDWSPWYQELVSSEEAVTYSCTVKGNSLRSPEVSVDSVTSTCFSVTYAKGRMCSNQTSVDKSCSITYARHYEVQVQGTSPVTVSCTTSCPVSDRQTAYRWYQNRRLNESIKIKEFSTSSTESLSCAVKDQDHLLSPEVCPEVNNCWTVNYISRRICAVKGFSVNISSKYSHPNNPESKSWYKVETSGEKLIKAAGHVEYHDMKNQHILTIKQLNNNDSAEYKFTLQEDDEERKQDDVPGVTLVVTDLRVQLRSTVVTEGQRVTLTCRTSCPLPSNTNYIWYFNSRPLNLTHNQSKHLLLDPVSSQDAGNYSCAVKSISSSEKTLTVQITTGTLVAAVGVTAALLVVILLGVIYWFRDKRTSGQVPTTAATDNTEQLNDAYMYENISAESSQHDEHHYSEVQFSKNQTDATYSTVQPHPLMEEKQATYDVVSFRPNMNPE